MENNLFKRLVYLDHNVLDLMSKGGLMEIQELISEENWIPVYSNENLNEIRRSVGYEDSFLEVLDSMSARHIVPNMNDNFQYIGTATIFEKDPREAFSFFVDDVKEPPEFGYGLSGMVRKMYGGSSEISFSEIFEHGANEIGDLLDIPDEDIDALDIDLSMKEDIKKMRVSLPGMLKEITMETGRLLDNEASDNIVKQQELTIGVGPKILKNIKEPNVLLQVWDKVKETLPDDITTFEEYFGLDQSRWDSTPKRELSVIEKVNGIYHQLNFLGYYRDSKMKKDRRFKASFSDMTHAGMATFCRLFICRDEDLVMKAAAAYEYLGVQTKVVHLKQANKAYQRG